MVHSCELKNMSSRKEVVEDKVDCAEAGGSDNVNLGNKVVKSSVPSSPGKEKKKMGVTFAAGTTGNASKLRSQQGQQRKLPPQKSKSVSTNNIKKENLAQLIEKKKECEGKAHGIVLRLIETEVEKEYLLDNAIRISKQHLEDVIEERKLSQLCGWVLCDNPVDPNNVPKQTYSIRGHKVYDIRERKAFCSGKCYAKSVHFKAQLLTSPLWLRDMEEYIHFEIMEDDETTELHGLNVALTSVHLSDESEEENDVEGVEGFSPPK